MHTLFTRVGIVVAAMLLALAAVGAGSPAQVQPLPVPVASTTFNPVADSYTDDAAPSTNNGTKLYLYTDASPVRTSYLKFDVSGVSSFGSAALRLFVESSNSVGYSVRPVGDTSWGETTINFNNAPQTGSALGSTGPVTGGTWVSVDVTSAVQSNGLVSFALTSTSSTATKITSREGANPPQLIVGDPPASPSPFVISSAGGQYQATSAAGTVYTGSLKFVGEKAIADLKAAGGGTISFTAGTFDFGAEFFKIENVANIVFQGAGMNATVIRNNNSSASDTEPFNFTTADGVTIRDMTISAGGAARTTSDAIDLDNGSNTLIENVEITASRGRAVVYDGKNAGWNSHDNTLRNCVITGTQWHGVELLASTNNRIEGCQISNTAGSGIQINKSSTSAPQPNKKASNNVIIGNTIDQAGRDGIGVNGGDGNQITGNTVTNSANVSAGRDGIRVGSADGVSCNNTTVSANTSTDNQSTKTQRYGLHIATALCTATVVGPQPPNDFAGNLTAPIRDVGSGTIYQ